MRRKCDALYWADPSEAVMLKLVGTSAGRSPTTLSMRPRWPPSSSAGRRADPLADVW